MEKDDIKDVVLETYQVMLEAQLRAVRRLRGREEVGAQSEKSMSQVELVYDILSRDSSPLHINQIIEDVERYHGVRLDRESIVSALSKRVVREDRFIRTAKNTFGLREGER